MKRRERFAMCLLGTKCLFITYCFAIFFSGIIAMSVQISTAAFFNNNYNNSNFIKTLEWQIFINI